MPFHFKTGQCFKERLQINNSDKCAFFEGFDESVFWEIIGMEIASEMHPAAPGI